MAIYKNVASQKLAVYAYTASTGASKTGDAAQITAYLSKDWAAAAAIADTNPTELDSTNMPGWYVFDLAQAETNAEVLVVAPKSSTSGVVLDQVQVFTQAGDTFSRLGAPAGASVSADIADLPTVTEFNARTLAAADYTVVSDLPVAPDNASIAAILEDTGTTLDALIKDVPTVAEFEARTLVAASYFDPATDTVARVTLVDTTTTNTDVGAVKAVTDKIDTALVLDGAVYQFTANALELAPAGGGGTADWTAEERAQFRYRLQIDGTQTAPTDTDLPAVNVTQVKGATIADLDASGNVLAKLAGGVTHGDWSSYLLLKSLDIRNDDVGGIGAYIRSSDAILGGRAVQIDGIGLSKAVEINGIFDADMSGTIDGLSSDAQQDVANALGIAPTSGTPATGSVYADLDAIKLITDAIDASAVTVTSSNNAGVLTFTQGSTFAATVSGLTISATWAKLYFTLKESDYDTDDLALLQLVETNPGAGTDGLLYLAGDAIASPITVADGTLTVSQAAGTVAIAITDNATALLSKASGLVWDIKTKDAAGATVQNTTGTASITRAVTQTI